MDPNWQNKFCGTCAFITEAPRPGSGVVDLKAKKVFICREGPPTIVYAIGQQQGPHGQQGPPQVMPFGSMYAPIDPNYPACSRYSEKEIPKFDFDKSKSTPEVPTK